MLALAASPRSRLREGNILAASRRVGRPPPPAVATRGFGANAPSKRGSSRRQAARREVAGQGDRPRICCACGVWCAGCPLGRVLSPRRPDCPLLHCCAFIGLPVLPQECLADLSPRARPSLCTLARRLGRVAEEISESRPQQALRSVPLTLACRPGEVEPAAKHSRREKHPQISRG